MDNATEEMPELTPEEVELDASWKRTAAAGEITQAIRMRRALFGGGLMAASRAVHKYRDELPEDQRHETIELSEEEAVAEFEKILPLCGTLDDVVQRRLNKALHVLNGHVLAAGRPGVVSQWNVCSQR